MTAPQSLRHGRVTLALHALRSEGGPPLLLLHGLRGSAADWDAAATDWAGAVFALDFCGHGRSGWVVGGAYTPELLAADADAALTRIGPAAVAGQGIGAYVALLLAGARPELVPAALLLPGAGLEGGGPLPSANACADPEWAWLAAEAPSRGGEIREADPLVRALEHDPRPGDYAEAFAARARCLVLPGEGGSLPAWWEAAANSRAALRVSRGEAWQALQRLGG